MLRKMYLVSADQFHKNKDPPTSPPTYPAVPKRHQKEESKKRREHPFVKWVKFRKEIRDAGIRHKTQRRFRIV